MYKHPKSVRHKLSMNDHKYKYKYKYSIHFPALATRRSFGFILLCATISSLILPFFTPTLASDFPPNGSINPAWVASPLRLKGPQEEGKCHLASGAAVEHFLHHLWSRFCLGLWTAGHWGGNMAGYRVMNGNAHTSFGEELPPETFQWNTRSLMDAESGAGGRGAANSLSVFGRVRAHAGWVPFFSLTLSYTSVSLHNISSLPTKKIIISRCS